MKVESFNDGWKYWKDSDAFALIWETPQNAMEVTLPHDAMLESPAYADSKNGGNTGYRDGNVYNYVKLLDVDESWKQKTAMLKFDGIYMNAMVYVNGALAAKCPYGYTGFFVPLNDHLKYGEENEIRVIVRNGAMPNSRWYSGGGIYRDAWLLTAPETYIVPEKLQVVTEELEEDLAVLRIHTALKNRSTIYHKLYLCTELIDADGNVKSTQKVPLTLYSGEERTLTSRMTVRDPRPWSAESANLYQVRSSLYEGDTLLDVNIESFGIRKMTLDAVHGLRVNGKSVKLKGACIHHDSGILGAATFYDAEYRRIRIMKEAGFNAIRMAHHPAAPTLLRACDELGMYVMDEVSDMWTRCKTDNDYGLFFTEWWERDVEAMVRKDYNHPSVILYSVGNEIPEIGMDQGSKFCHKICEKIKSMDSDRYTLASINGMFAAGDLIPQIMDDLKASGKMDGNINDFMAIMAGHQEELKKIVTHPAVSHRIDMACASTDIAGYNYMSARYEEDGVQYPDRVIIGSETNPPDITENWDLVKKLSYVVGDFTWTGWDYIGEAGVGIPAYPSENGGFGAKFPCQLAYCGDIDITGFRRPLSYLREIVFAKRQAPYIAVQNPEKYGQFLIKTPWILSDAISSWTYHGMEGKPVIVEVYASGDSVELFLNGKSLGRKACEGYITRFETTYEPGKLEAVAYKSGQELGRTNLQTAEGTGSLHVNVENGKNSELVFVEISNQDEKGIVITDSEVTVRYEAQSDAQIRFGSGDPKTDYSYITNETKTWHGRALLTVRKKNAKEQIPITLMTGGQRVTLEL